MEESPLPWNWQNFTLLAKTLFTIEGGEILMLRRLLRERVLVHSWCSLKVFPRVCLNHLCFYTEACLPKASLSLEKGSEEEMFGSGKKNGSSQIIGYNRTVYVLLKAALQIAFSVFFVSRDLQAALYFLPKKVLQTVRSWYPEKFLWNSHLLQITGPVLYFTYQSSHLLEDPFWLSWNQHPIT